MELKIDKTRQEFRKCKYFDTYRSKKKKKWWCRSEAEQIEQFWKVNSKSWGQFRQLNICKQLTRFQMPWKREKEREKDRDNIRLASSQWNKAVAVSGCQSSQGENSSCLNVSLKQLERPTCSLLVNVKRWGGRGGMVWRGHTSKSWILYLTQVFH